MAESNHSDATSSKVAKMPDLGDFRMTRQRRVVYDVLTDELDHPTAAEVFVRCPAFLSPRFTTASRL